MAFNIASIKANLAVAAPRLVIMGVSGIGKSTFAAYSPKPVFVLTEDGLGSLQAQHFPLAKNIASVMSALTSLADEPHDYKTCVLDSLDWTEALIFAELEAKYTEQQLSFGKSAVLAADKWRTILAALDVLRTKRGMNIICICHPAIKRFDAPDSPPFDRWVLKLQERSSSLIKEWCDALLFANWKTTVVSTDVGFSKLITRGVSTGERLLYTSERPAYMAKNRYALPESIPLDWDALYKAINPKKE